MRLSSTIMILRCLTSIGTTSSFSSGFSTTRVWIVKLKELPFLSSLSTHILPPIFSMSCFEMVRPRPVPPYFRVVELSACVKLSNIFSCFSFGIPTPVSETEKYKTILPSFFSFKFTLITISPCSVNFMALPTRLTSIWRSLTGSPEIYTGTSWFI